MELELASIAEWAACVTKAIYSLEGGKCGMSMQYRANPGGYLKANVAPSEENTSHIQLLCVKDKMKLLGGSSKANKQDLKCTVHMFKVCVFHIYPVSVYRM